MSKIQILLSVISDLTSLAESLKEYAQAISKSDELTVGNLNDYEVISTPNEIQEEMPQQKEEKIVDRTAVRAKLAELTRNGHSDEVKKLLRKYGTERFSGIDDSELPALMEEAEKIGT